MLQDRVILVTGAGQGLGREAALAFASEGAVLILLGRTQAKLEAVYDDITQAGYPQPLLFPCDLEHARAAEFTAIAEGIYQQVGRLDGLLHNASRFDNLSPLEIQTAEQLQGMLQTNLVAPFLLTQACLPLFKRAPDASVIVTSHTAAQQAQAFWGMHAASRAGAEMLFRIMAQELEVLPTLRINIVLPGPVQGLQREKSHPAESPASRTPVSALMPLYRYLMGPRSVGVSGRTFDAASWQPSA